MVPKRRNYFLGKICSRKESARKTPDVGRKILLRNLRRRSSVQYGFVYKLQKSKKKRFVEREFVLETSKNVDLQKIKISHFNLERSRGLKYRSSKKKILISKLAVRAKKLTEVCKGGTEKTLRTTD